MATRQRTILGVSPGSRLVGLAVMRGGELIEWCIRTFDGTFSSDKRTRIGNALEEIVERYEIKVIAYKITGQTSSPGINAIRDTVVELAKRKRITLRVYPLPHLTALCDKTTNPTKQDLVGFVAETYPVVASILRKEEQCRHSYYTKLFEAVAASHACHVGKRGMLPTSSTVRTS